MPPFPQAVLFDWDNTLVDTWPCIIHAMNHTLEAMGHAPWSEAEARARIARSLRDAFPELFGERWEEARGVFYAAFSRVHLDMLVALPAAAEALEALKALGVPLGIVSNKTGAYLRQEVEHLGWQGHFTAVVGAGDATRDKPAIDPVLLALEGSGLAPAETVWFLGDSLVDMQCAAESGCTGVFLHPEPPPLESFGPTPPHLFFRGCEEFLHHLRGGQFP